MIRTPGKTLKRIYEGIGTCDVFEFGKNVKMSTDQDYSFLDNEKLVDKTNYDMKQFRLEVDEMEKYSERIINEM